MAYRSTWIVAYLMGPTWRKTKAFATREEACRVRARFLREGRAAHVIMRTT